MGQVCCAPAPVQSEHAVPAATHGRLDPAGLQKIEVASFGYSQLQTQAVHAGTQDMACSWTGVAFLDLISIGRFQSSHIKAYSVPMGVLGGSFAGISGAFWERGVSPSPLRAE